MAKTRTAQTVHASNADGTRHLVCITDLRVLLTRHADYWFAQGVEIDYAAEGRDIDDVRRAFEYGLAQTISAHLRTFANIEGLLRPARDDAQRAISGKTVVNRYSQVSAHVFPFAIEFVEAAA